MYSTWKLKGGNLSLWGLCATLSTRLLYEATYVDKRLRNLESSHGGKKVDVVQRDEPKDEWEDGGRWSLVADIAGIAGIAGKAGQAWRYRAWEATLKRLEDGLKGGLLARLLANGGKSWRKKGNGRKTMERRKKVKEMGPGSSQCLRLSDIAKSCRCMINLTSSSTSRKPMPQPPQPPTPCPPMPQPPLSARGRSSRLRGHQWHSSACACDPAGCSNARLRAR